MTEIHAFDPDGTPSPGAEAGVSAIMATTLDPQVASYVATATQTRAALDESYTQKPAPAEREYWVTPRGDDAADGLTLATAKRTITAAVAALAGAAGTIHLGAGTFALAGDVAITSNLRILGAGRHLTTISYTGAGAAIHGVPNARTYNFEMSGLHLRGPGKATETTGLDLVDMSQATITDFLITSFGVGVMHRADAPGGAVYNTFTDGFFTSCGTGVEFGPRGSNGSRWSYVKWGACDIAVDIRDSNQNNFHACQFEVNGTAIRISASLAGLSDHNSFDHCRFETNDISWNIVDSKVRDTAITWPATFGTITRIDYGTRTHILAASAQIYPPGSRRQILTRAGSYTLGAADDIVVIDAPSSTATLPDASTIEVGRTYTLKNPRSGDLTVASLGGTIDKGTTISIAPMQAASIVSDGANWWTI